MLEAMPPWVIAVTRPAAEEVAERNFRQSGYRVYLPRYRKLMRPHGLDRRGQSSMRPLFTGYLFIHDWRGWPDIGINGAAGLMKSSGRNVQMLDADVTQIWARERDGSFDETETPRSSQRRTDLSLGDCVEIDILGQRVLAILEDLTDNGKAIVRGMMFGREIPWTVNAGELHKIVS